MNLLLKWTQHGTEVPLWYDAKIAFTNKPTNLIFYSDREKTKAIIMENDKYINLGGFFSLEDNKKRNMPIYWEWKFETGDTQEEIYKNDLIDSSFMGEKMSMQIETTGKQVTEKPTGKHVIMYNANGGVFSKYGNAKITTKQVVNDEQRGETPIPTRDGYRFVGWSTVEDVSEIEDSINLYALWTEIK